MMRRIGFVGFLIALAVGMAMIASSTAVGQKKTTIKVERPKGGVSRDSDSTTSNNICGINSPAAPTVVSPTGTLAAPVTMATPVLKWNRLGNYSDYLVEVDYRTQTGSTQTWLGDNSSAWMQRCADVGGVNCCGTSAIMPTFDFADSTYKIKVTCSATVCEYRPTMAGVGIPPFRWRVKVLTTGKDIGQTCCLLNANPWSSYGYYWKTAL